jgi:hypothetical protein
MIAADVETLATILDSAYQEGLVGPEVVAMVGLGCLAAPIGAEVHEVEDGGGEAVDLPPLLVGHVAGYGQRFEKDLRAHHRRTEVQKHPSLELLDAVGQGQEIAVRGLAQSRSIAVGMLIDDVVADAHMYCHRHPQPVACR